MSKVLESKLCKSIGIEAIFFFSLKFCSDGQYYDYGNQGSGAYDDYSSYNDYGKEWGKTIVPEQLKWNLFNKGKKLFINKV